ncbi:MAG: hypothetical protein PHV57_04290, partial [Methanomicrobiaceae archaeon]|nr:hypothetical protein [Methanomicrobiaceae archaeon]
RIGWLSYFIALVVVHIVISIVQFVLLIIPGIGILLLFLLSPAFVIFYWRYITLIYDSAQPGAQQVTGTTGG